MLLIAAAVLFTVLVKQLVDYQFNEITKEAFVTRDSIGAFQGKFFAATQWLPLLVLVGLRPVLQRFGVGLVVLLLPVALLAANLGLALSWSLAAAVAGKASDAAFRYTAERAGREILYVPLPDTIKLKAKAYIDMAVEKGLGKVLSAALIFGAVFVIDYRKVGYLGVGLGVVWIGVALAVRAEYVRSLARSIRGRFASFEGVFAWMADASTIPVMRETLAGGDERTIAFALDLVDQADPASVRPLIGSLHALLDHSSPEIRERALAVLADFTDDVDWSRVRERVSDPVESVRMAAVRTICRAGSDRALAMMKSLLECDEHVVRMAALSCIVAGDVPTDMEIIDRGVFEARLAAARAGDPEARVEVALMLAAMPDEPSGPGLLDSLLRDGDPRVAGAALRAAGRLGRREHVPALISALGSPKTREAAREALVELGERVEGTLSDYLEDEAVPLSVRRSIPAVMVRIPTQAAVDDLLRFLGTFPRDRLLRYRVAKALNKLRASDAGLVFEPGPVYRVLEGEIEASVRHASAARAVAALHGEGPALSLLRRALRDAWLAGRERVFRYLGLLYPPEPIYHAYLTLGNGGPSARANAMEWLEQTLGRALFRKIEPAIRESELEGPTGAELQRTFAGLLGGGDVWVADCAAWALAELRPPWAEEELRRARSSGQPDLACVAERALARMMQGTADAGQAREHGEMNLIEKVFLLHRIDLLQEARSEELALLASIAEEVEVRPGTVLLTQGEPTDALYVVIRGAVELRRAGEQVLTAQDGTPFGTWALIDESPSLVGATAVTETHLLRIAREDFYDLLADHSELARGLLKGLARRVRALVA